MNRMNRKDTRLIFALVFLTFQKGESHETIHSNHHAYSARHACNALVDNDGLDAISRGL